MCIFLYLWKYIFELYTNYFFISSQLDIRSTNSLGIVQVDQQPTYTESTNGLVMKGVTMGYDVKSCPKLREVI